MFRGAPLHAGDASSLATPAWELAWSVELGERIDASAVVTGDGRAIVATRGGTVVAVDVATGAERARVRLPAGVWSSPAMSGGVLIVAAKDARAYGLDARTLATVWRRKLPSPWLSGVTVARGVAYIASGTTLVALDAATGRERWRRSTGARVARAVAVDVDRDVIVGANRGGQVLAFHLDGRLRWTAATSAGAHNDGPPTIASDLVLVGSNDRTLYAFDLATGRRVWTSPTRNWVVSSAAVVDGRVYTGDDGGLLRCLDLRDGTVLWTARVGDDLASSPTIVGDLVIHGAHDGNAWAHDKRTGTPLPPIPTGAPIFASPAVSPTSTIILATHTGRLLGIR